MVGMLIKINFTFKKFNFDFINVVTSTYAHHNLNARNELLAGNVFFKENIIINTE